MSLRDATDEEVPSVPHDGAHVLAIRRAEDEELIGVLQCRASHPAPGWLSIENIELKPERRGWGYGSEAVRLLEAESLRQGMAKRFRAEVPAGNGLALYFWLRLGYRPEGIDIPRTEVRGLEGAEVWRSEEGDATMAMIRTPE